MGFGLPSLGPWHNVMSIKRHKLPSASGAKPILEHIQQCLVLLGSVSVHGLCREVLGRIAGHYEA
jgi:hypothetical protein